MACLRTGSLVAGLVAALTLLSSAVATGATGVAYAIAGIETGFTDTSSSFAGTALAQNDVALWQALVERTPFDADRNAVITGGAFRLDGRVRDLQGIISGGTITNLRSNCRRELFAIEGDITLTDASGVPTGGTGHFAATLTHYLARLHGECVTYFATVEGSVTFTSP